MFNIRICAENFKALFKQDVLLIVILDILFWYQVNLISAIVAQISDVASGPLVWICKMISPSFTVMVFQLLKDCVPIVESIL